MPHVDAMVHATAGAPTAADERALADIARHLEAEYAGIDPATVRATLAEGFERTAEARVQNYRLVLAERWARHRLRTGADGPPVPADAAGRPTAAPAGGASGRPLVGAC